MIEFENKSKFHTIYKLINLKFRSCVLILFSIFSCNNIYAQTSSSTDNSMINKNSASPSGNVNSGVSAGSNLNVDLYTGRLQCSLPIFTLSSSDLQIPISLDYTAGAGVKVQDLNTTVGLSWSLNAGGNISRIVRGIPDESTNGYIGSNAQGATVINAINTQGNTYSYNFYSRTTGYYNDYPPLDGEPDLFYIKTPFFSLQFTIDQSGNAIVQGNPGFKITHSLYNNSTSATNTGIEVIDDKGNKFLFGSSSSSREIASTSFFGKPFNYNSSWFLDKIITYNTKDVISFEYNLETSYSIENYQLSKSFTATFDNSGTPPSGFPISTTDAASRISSKSTITFIEPKYISKIVTKLGSATFSYTNTPYQYVNAANPPELTGIEIKQILPSSSDGLSIRNFTLFYDEVFNGITGWTQPYPYTDIWADYYRRLLKFVKVSGNSTQTNNPINVFELKYNQDQQFPNRAMVQNCDYWGFINSTTFSPDGGSNGGQDLSYFTNPESYRLPSIYNNGASIIEIPTASLMALKEVDNMEGDVATIDYELNTYYSNTDGYNKQAGGCRVNKITHSLSTGEQLFTSYIYDNNTGQSTGQLYNNLYKKISLYFGAGPNFSTLSFSQSPYNFIDNNGVFLGYSSVKVVSQNGQYEKFDFTNFSDFPDEMNTPGSFAYNWINPGNWPSNVSSVMSSYAYKRGLLKSNSIYKGNNSKVSETLNTYGSLDGQPSTTAFGIQDLTWFLKAGRSAGLNTVLATENIYKSYIENWRLLQTTQKSYDDFNNSIQTINTYTYCPDKRSVKGINSLDSKGNSVTKTFYHSNDTNIPMITGDEQNALTNLINNNCNSVLVHELDNKNGAVSETHNSYNISPEFANTYLLNVSAFKGGNTVPVQQQLFKYDPRNSNLVTSNIQNGINTSILYGYNYSLPIAKIVNAKSFYSSTTNNVISSQSTFCNFSDSKTFTTTAIGSINLSIGFSNYPGSGTVTNAHYSLTGPSNATGDICLALSGGSGCNQPSSVQLLNMPIGNYTISVTGSSSYPSSNPNINIQFPIINTVISPVDEFFYEGFEQNYGFAIFGSAHTGNYYFDATTTAFSVNFAIPNSRQYVMQWWNWVNGKWIFNEQSYTGITNLSGIIDDIRIFPSDAQMTTYTHSPLIGKTGETDPSGRTITYEYDGLGRKNIIRDNDKNIISKTCYNLSGQPINCITNASIFTNVAKSGTFAKNNCPSGLIGTSAIYNVPPNIYTSSINQLDADQQALNDVNTNGQAYVNSSASGATCITPFYNTVQSGNFTRNNCDPNSIGSSVTYTVPANTYSSSIDVNDANQKALNDISINGQNNANAIGTCTLPPINITGKTSYSYSSSSGSGTISSNAGRLVRVNISASGSNGFNYSINVTVSGVTITGTTNVTNGTTFFTFTMPASGSVNFSAYFTATNSYGSGSISVQ